MKIIHTADLHIDSPLSLDLNPAFQKDRKRELLYNFERLINYANDNGVHIILISGDSDFVPAAKQARREGIDFILDPMRSPIKEDLFEHIDGMRTKAPKLSPSK